MTEKRVVLIKPDGSEETFLEGDAIPTYEQMKSAVDGWIELVKVIRRDVSEGFVYTYMVVNEESLIHGMPRNQAATDLYLENMRRQYPDKSPGEAREAASAAYRAALEQTLGRPVEHIELPEPKLGYNADPHICGPVLYFEGWTIWELQAAGF